MESMLPVWVSQEAHISGALETTNIMISRKKIIGITSQSRVIKKTSMTVRKEKSSYSKMELDIKVNGRRRFVTVLVSKFGQMVPNTKDIGKT